jgi:hypothetical protein
LFSFWKAAKNTNQLIISFFKKKKSKFTIESNSRGFKKVNFRGFESRNLTHGELGKEFRSLILGEVESSDIELNTRVSSL